VADWDEALPMIVRATQNLFGRGLARELNGQLRLALEEYR
jgi:phosphoserine phosphatase RsbU/P